MIPELATYSLILALCLSLLQAIMPLLGIVKEKSLFYQFARPACTGSFIFVFFSFICLIIAFLQNDFTVAYIARNSATSLPLFYRIAAVWGAHEGSLLLWIVIVTGWSFILIHCNRNIPGKFLAVVLSVLGFMNSGFLWFLLKTSSPFSRTLPNVPFEGLDSNPLLQDPGLMLHPPMLYFGYVGFAITFAFAISGLLLNNIDQQWARWVRPWAVLSWLALTLGIVLGSWWSYHVLGWGGWWFWDPVENASFLPWLLATALIHSLILVEKRNQFQYWTVLLALLTYTMSLIGTFLVRSGVLISVHAFATDPERGAFLLKYIFVLIFLSMILFAVKVKQQKKVTQFFILSREAFLLIGNVLLIVITASIALGTLYPLIIEVLGFGKLSVGEPYFNAIFTPLMIILMITMAMGVTSAWYQTNPSVLTRSVIKIVLLSVVATVLVLTLLSTAAKWLEVIGIWVGLCLIIATVFQFKTHSIGMSLAHIGIGIICIAIAITANLSIEKAIRMSIDETVTLGKYQIQFINLQPLSGSNYKGKTANFTISLDKKTIASVPVNVKDYTIAKNQMTEPGIYASIFYDIYVVLGEPYPNGEWSVRMYYKPFIRWIWLGGLLIFIGGLLALVQRTRRKTHAI